VGSRYLGKGQAALRLKRSLVLDGFHAMPARSS
jgi:hypothetical protein